MSSTKNMEEENEITKNHNNAYCLKCHCASKEIESALPTSANLELEKDVQLASNNNSMSNIHGMDEEVKNTHEPPKSEENVQSIEGNDDDKYPTLKDVVEKVLSDNTQENTENINHSNVLVEAEPITIEANTEEKEKSDIITPEAPIEVEETKETTDSKEEPKDEEPTATEETPSPSQSECSRATRWEALADIAAELPPSLAVDPVTGLIYSLAK